MVIPSNETFDGTWPFVPHFTRASGFEQHYVDEGPRGAETILCLHGEPTWGYLYRKMIAPLSETFRVVVPDHMGFGKSETPQDRVYTLQSHVENLERFVEALDLRDITIAGDVSDNPNDPRRAKVNEINSSIDKAANIIKTFRARIKDLEEKAEVNLKYGDQLNEELKKYKKGNGIDADAAEQMFSKKVILSVAISFQRAFLGLS